MPNYTLKIGLLNQQLDNLEACNASIIIAKPSEGGEGPNVAWQTIKPLENNTLRWTEDYGIYVSNTELVHGANLDQLSSTSIPAGSDMLYTIKPSGAISGPAPGGAEYSYALLNSYDKKSYMTVGLFQDANVNGTDIIGNATSAVPVLLANTAVMTPYTTVYIWVQSQVVSNTVVTTVTSPMTELKFGAEVQDISVVYDSNSGRFISAD